jgi:hypothetical protein
MVSYRDARSRAAVYGEGEATGTRTRRMEEKGEDYKKKAFS